jgi:hypothetical protein
MTPSLHWSLRAYERLLILYPEDLRRDFGVEMLEAFSEDLAAAHGIGGALRVWRSALREVMQIAVPAWCEIPAVMVPLLSAAIVAASQSPLIILAARRYLLANLIAVGIGSVIAAMTSFVAIHRWKRTGLITLRIG